MFPVADSLLRRRYPFINLTLIGFCAAVFVYELLLGETGRLVFFYQFGVIPSELWQGTNYSSLVTRTGTLDINSPVPNWATVFTSMFIHGDWMHFAANMLFLWVFGDNIEDRFGHFRYLLFYMVAGIAAAALQIMVDTASEIPTIGASGAIAGVLGAYLILFPLARIRTLVFLFFITFIRIPAMVLLGFWFLLQFVSGIGSLGPSAQGSGVAYWAHIGGFVFGMAIAIIYRITVRRPPDRPEVVRYWRGRPI